MTVPDREALHELLEQKFPVSAALATREISLESLLRYTVGSVIVLGKASSDHLSLEVNGCEVARGAAVTLNGRFAIRLQEVQDPRETIEKIL